ncbi:MAG: MFS transporter [Acidobacteriota bacterium]|nr:MFS transporter [Acidobacteriota bacterium]
MSSRTAALTAAQPANGVRPLAQATILPLVLFSLGHFFVDLYSGSLGVLQPLILRQFGLSFTQAGILGGLLSFSSSVTQPLYGYLSDRFHSRLFTVLAPAVAGIFISTLGWASGFPMLLLMVFLAGAGMASFHPQAASNATNGIERNRARAMAIFISCGTLGLAFGPTYFSLITARWGLSGAYGAAVPGVFVTLLLLIFLRPFHRPAGLTANFSLQPLRSVWKPMSVLYLLVFLRSVVQITFTQFLPLYLQTTRGYSLPKASYSLSLYLVGGAIGGIAGGNFADRFGGKRVILISMLGSIPLLALFVFTTGFLSAMGMFLSGLVLLFTIPVNLVMAQQLAPTQTATVSSLMMGFAWGMAGIVFIPLTGWVADHYSMQAAFTALIAVPLIGFLLALKLPE